MKELLESGPVASVIVVVVALAGAVVTITNPDTLAFSDYVESVGVAAGLLAVGRGIASAGRH